MTGGGDEGGERADVREAFSLLAHDIRLDIVLALLENWAAVYTEPQSYSELMDAVELRDSGKFNYHLDKLTGVYVEQVEGGYVPTASAVALYRTVLAHRPTETVRQAGELERLCPHCGGTLVEEYERSFYTLDCTDCDSWELMTYVFPKNGLRGRRGTQRYRAVMERASYHIGLARTGQCPFCAGRVQFEFAPDRVEEMDPPSVDMTCTTCTWYVSIGLLTPLRFDPRVAAALARLGVEEPGTDDAVDVTGGVRSEDPLRVEATVETDEGSASVVVDEELDVQSVEVTTAE
jgi:hypothetical protein